MDCTPTHLATVVKRWIERGRAPTHYVGLDMIEMCDSVIEQTKPTTPYDPTDAPPQPLKYHYLVEALAVCTSAAREFSGAGNWHPDGTPMKRLDKIKTTAERAIRDYNRQLCQKEEDEKQAEKV